MDLIRFVTGARRLSLQNFACSEDVHTYVYLISVNSKDLIWSSFLVREGCPISATCTCLVVLDTNMYILVTIFLVFLKFLLGNV